MSEPELINSASKDSNNETEESETSDDEYWSCANPVFQKSL